MTALALPVESAVEAKFPGELKLPKVEGFKAPKIEGFKAPKLPKVRSLPLNALLYLQFLTVEQVEGLKLPKPFLMTRSEAIEFKEPGILKADKKIGKDINKDFGKAGKEAAHLGKDFKKEAKHIPKPF